MIFKDREDAGKKLSDELLKDKNLLKNRKNIIVISLLRGGVVVGKVIAKTLKAEHVPMVATKIPAPHNPELAIGAICFTSIFLQQEIIKQLGLKGDEIRKQASIAKEKQKEYIKMFSLGKVRYDRKIKNKIIIIVDDGIATGATTKAALLFVKSNKPKKIILAVSVAPTDLAPSVTEGFDKVLILHRDPYFSSVSQFYESFPQVTDNV